LLKEPAATQLHFFWDFISGNSRHNNQVYVFHNSKQNEFQGLPKLFKIYPAIQHLNKMFQNLYLPNQNIAIDESLTLWKSRLSHRQYIPLKAAKLCIKTYELCESSSSYVWSFLVYIGGMELMNQFVTAETNKSAAIIVKLLENLLSHGHRVCMNGFCDYPELAWIMKSRTTDCVGTSRAYRRNVHPVVNKKRKKGEHHGQGLGDVAVLAWREASGYDIHTPHG
jgi:hypothetical protein